MKITDLIKTLETLKEKHGEDQKIRFLVRDHYSRHGHWATINLDTSGVLWHGISTSGKHTTLDVHLDDYEEFNGDIKHPKVSFRKSRY